MKVLHAAERRLIAALDRLDHAVEQSARRLSEATAAAQDAGVPVAPEVTTEVSPQIAALHDRQSAMLEAMQKRLGEAHARLAASGEQAARLAAANDELAQANRALIEAAGGGPDAWAQTAEGAVLAALQAEVDALRAARAAEVERMGEILDALDRMLGVETPPNSQPAGDGTRIVTAAAATAPPASDGPGAGDDAARSPGSGGIGQRELSVLRDEDPLPEDEPVSDADADFADAEAEPPPAPDRPADKTAHSEEERG